MGTLKYLFRKYFGNRYLKRLIQKRPPTLRILKSIALH